MNTDMDYRIFNVRTDVNACDCTQRRMDTVKESALKVDSEKNPLLHQGIEPVSAVCKSDALPTELHPHPIHSAEMKRKREHRKPSKGANMKIAI